MCTVVNSIYPSYFPIKIIGKNYPGFAEDIFNILNSYDSFIEYSYDDPTLSRSGKYISLTVNINIISRDYFDEIYRLLYANPHVSFVL